MIRFVDLRHVSEDLGGDRFAFFDTVTDRFIADGLGSQTWETFSDFKEGCDLSPTQKYDLQRFGALTPEWARTP